MSSSYTVSLFTEPTDHGPRPTSIAVSFVLHSLAIAVVWFGVAYMPPIVRVSTEHFRVRELDLDIPDDMRTPPHISAPAANAGAHAPATEGKPSPSDPALREVAQATPGPQTLIQPDIEHPVTLPDQIPVPQALIWSPSKVTVKKVTPPAPQKPSSSDVKPSVERPNEEITLADVKIASSFHPTPRPIITASTTSPVAVHVPQQVLLPPVTSSHTSAQPTPASILSLSNLRMKEGIATLPPVNESLVVKGPGTLAGQGKDASTPGKDSSPAKAGQGGTSQGPAGNPNNQGSGAGQGLAFKVSGPGLAAPANKPQGPETGNGDDPDSLATDQLSTTIVTVPKDGHFSAIIVGNALDDRYPEIAGVWNERIAYTVYLHVGLSHSWVLQYSLPRTVDTAGSAATNHLDAPWPYDIVRPNLDPGSIDADALMVHGFVNQSGRFETLSIVFPQAFPQAQFVIAALEKWQFRPAMQNGQSAKVEVLLIIPEQSE
ncbi:MAG: hypothetical protein ACLPLZ_11225 [Terracidiphilus sp.]